MSIQKKSLISTLKTTKKANAVSSAPETSHEVSSRQSKAAPAWNRNTKSEVIKRESKRLVHRADKVTLGRA